MKEWEVMQYAKNRIATSSVDGSVRALLALGVQPSMIYIGVAFYSRGTRGLGRTSEAGKGDMSREEGVCDYKSLPRAGSVEYWDPYARAGYSYDEQRGVLNSYDTVASVQEKCRYVWDLGLGGVFCWEASGDHPGSHPRSLTRALYEGLAHGRQ